MPTDSNPKQLIAQRLKDATNILVTVSHDPGVDELSAALALTLMLDKMEKTPTAVVSGTIPPAIEFLDPEKTFDTNVDSLRDFIIALDKSKADRLRYKVEGDVVRVFITPYKTTITEKDLTFAQGDFNVDLVVAIGVEKREDLDTAIAAHGRILHDATVVTINQLSEGSTLGEIDWNEPSASSLCEMLMNLTEALQPGLLDEPISTAILTGLVATTDRFRNDKTSPKVMTMAAQLMAAGANQQLIAEKLEAAESVSTGKLNEMPDEEKTPPKRNDGEMKVDHEEGAEKESPDTKPVAKAKDGDALDEKAAEVSAQERKNAVKEAKRELEQIAETKPAQPVAANQPKSQPVTPHVEHAKTSSWRDTPSSSTNGTLNATSEQSGVDKRKVENEDRNRIILSHDAPVSANHTSGMPPVLNATTLESPEPTVKDIFQTSSDQPVSVSESSVPAVSDIELKSAPQTASSAATSSPSGLQFEETPIAGSKPQVNPTLADLEAQVSAQFPQTAQPSSGDSLESARAAVDAALGSQPFDPSGKPLESTGAQPGITISHDGQIASSEPPVSTPPAPTATGAAPLPPLPPLPPMPDFSTLPPLPNEQPSIQQIPSTLPAFGLPEQQPGPDTTPQTPTAAPSNDPGQFQLPGTR